MKFNKRHLVILLLMHPLNSVSAHLEIAELHDRQNRHREEGNMIDDAAEPIFAVQVPPAAQVQAQAQNQFCTRKRKIIGSLLLTCVAAAITIPSVLLTKKINHDEPADLPCVSPYGTVADECYFLDVVGCNNCISTLNFGPMSNCSMQGALNSTSLKNLAKNLLEPACGGDDYTIYRVYNIPCAQYYNDCKVHGCNAYNCRVNGCNQCMSTCLVNNTIHREKQRHGCSILNQARVDLKPQKKDLKKKVVQKQPQSKTRLKRLNQLLFARHQLPKHKKQYR